MAGGAYSLHMLIHLLERISDDGSLFDVSPVDAVLMVRRRVGPLVVSLGRDLLPCWSASAGVGDSRLHLRGPHGRVCLQ